MIFFYKFLGGVWLMKFMEILDSNFRSLKSYMDIDKYKLTPRAFSQNGVWSFFDYVIFILTNKGKSLTLEIEDFVEKHFDDDEEKLITKSGFSKQRQTFSYEIFIDMNRNFVKEFYKSEEYVSFFKDKIVIIIDGSRSEIPNTPESKEWANIKEDSLTNKKASRVLFSTAIDAKYGIVLDAQLGKADSSERELLKKHIKNIKDLVDLKKTILVIDAGYYSLELKLFLERMKVNYVFRLAPNVYEKEISNMTSYDEILRISNTSGRRQSIKDVQLLEKAKKLPWIEARILKIPIPRDDGEDEDLILLTDLPQNKFNTFEIAGLYNDRWEIEVNYDRLKNKMELENYSGKLELTISQDFYAKIYVFNLAMVLRNNIHKHLERKNEKKREEEDKEYRTNINTLIGRIKNKLIELFTSDEKKRQKIYDRIIRRGIRDTCLHDFNRPKIYWHEKIFIGKFRFNQRRNS